MYKLRVQVCERMIKMVGRISGTTGQFEYKVDSGRGPGRNRFAEDKKKSTDEMFFFKSCAFFCGLK